jgi:hypothetical protein
MKVTVSKKQIEEKLMILKDTQTSVYDRITFYWGLFIGLIMGLLTNLWVTLIYELLFKDSGITLKCFLLVLISGIFIVMIIFFNKQIKKGVDLSKKIDVAIDMFKTYKQQQKK